MNISLILVAVLLGPILYIIITLNGEKAETYQSYYYANRKVSPNRFIDTTIIYALQVAAITLFTTWGYQYGFWVILVPVFWGMGYYLISFLIDRGHLDSFLQQENIGTIHQFISLKGKKPLLGVFAALASLLGIAGPAMYEAQFSGELVARISTAMIGSEKAATIIPQYATLFFICFVLMAAIYILYGGFQAIVRTDIIQLGIGYSCLTIGISFLLLKMVQNGYFCEALFFTTLFFILSIFILFCWLRTFFQEFRHDGLFWNLFASLFPIAISVFIYTVTFIVIFIIPDVDRSCVFSFDSWSEIFRLHKFDKPFALGAMSLLSLFIANSLYQVVDIGQWQRLASVDINGNGYAEKKRELSKALKVAMIYSPITWIICVLFGMLLHYVSADIVNNPYDEFVTFLIGYQSAGILGQVVVSIFILSLISIMFSTLDSLVSSIVFTIHNDWLALLKMKQLQTVTSARIVTSLFLIITVCLYSWLLSRVNNFADILYSCWAFQIALFPIIWKIFKDGEVHGGVALISLVTGIIFSLLPVLVGGDFSIPLLAPAGFSAYEHAPFLSLMSSSLCMWAGYKFLK